MTALPEQHTTDRWCPAPHPPTTIPTGAPIWCLHHTEDIRAGLTRIPELAAQVACRRDGALNAGRSDTDRTRRTRTAPSPSPGHDLVEEVAQWAWAWADAIANHLGRGQVTAIPVRGDGVPVLHLRKHLDYLLDHLTPLLVGPMAVDFGEEALAWPRRLERAAGMERLRHRLPAPCPACGYLALVRDDGTDHVDCGNCHTRWDHDEYARLVRVLASEDRSA